MVRCEICGEEVIGDYFICPKHPQHCICAFHRRQGWPICPSCGESLHLIRVQAKKDQNIFAGTSIVLGSMVKKLLLMAGLAILIGIVIFFFWFIVVGASGGVIGFVIYWLDKKFEFSKITFKYMLGILLILLVISVIGGYLLYQPLHYLASGLIGFLIGYFWLGRTVIED